MSGLTMKLACLVLACMVVTGPITANAALECGTVNGKLASCIPYLAQGGPLRGVCCSDITSLNSLASSTPDRQQACRCLKRAARALGSYLDPGRAAGLPMACGVNIPYQISASTNCDTVK